MPGYHLCPHRLLQHARGPALEKGTPRQAFRARARRSSGGRRKLLCGLPTPTARAANLNARASVVTRRPAHYRAVPAIARRKTTNMTATTSSQVAKSQGRKCGMKLPAWYEEAADALRAVTDATD
ncbi:hypothetical protein ERJ75_001113800 [Trypanosoma vivax]|nr:hypothetical protein ERJ75_001113800 [Trypanosoma vivax]